VKNCQPLLLWTPTQTLISGEWSEKSVILFKTKSR
jgi:hypothetical protein